ncbi:MAG: formylmethanofuran dehydrogenase subunit C [Methanomicrobiales archaeon]|nr:formylmethanofuran dehydrogenase subunit C [Methanomicrobiales archaeon]
MSTVTLVAKAKPQLFLEMESVTPDAFAGKKASDIAELPVYEGNTTLRLADFFEVRGDGGTTAADTKIVIKGDATRLKYVGMRMTAGEIEVEGSIDQYVGAWMEGGRIHVHGNTDAFTGVGMKGGEILIDGNAGNYLGAAYRGDWRGMQGGRIHVKGNAGSDIGYYMNGGTIVVEGDVDVHVGSHMDGGRIVIKGNAKSKVGGQMVTGEIFILGTLEVMMPGFIYRKDVDIEVEGVNGKFALFEGDTAERHPKKKGQTVYGRLYLKV